MRSSQLGTRGVVVGLRLPGRKSKLWILKEENLRCAGMGSGALPPTSVQVFRGPSNQPQSRRWESPARKWAITMFTPQSTYHLWALLDLACYFSALPRPIGQLWRMVSAGCSTWRSLPSVAHDLSRLQSRSAPATLLCLVSSSRWAAPLQPCLHNDSITQKSSGSLPRIPSRSPTPVHCCSSNSRNVYMIKLVVA